MPNIVELKEAADQNVRDAAQALEDADNNLADAKEAAEAAHRENVDMGADAYARNCADFQTKVKQLKANLDEFIASKVG